MTLFVHFAPKCPLKKRFLWGHLFSYQWTGQLGLFNTVRIIIVMEQVRSEFDSKLHFVMDIFIKL